MKPFDLQKALAGEPVVTRDGRRVTQLHEFKLPPSQIVMVPCLAGIVEGNIFVWYYNGRSPEGYIAKEHRTDLLMAPARQTCAERGYHRAGDSVVVAVDVRGKFIEVASVRCSDCSELRAPFVMDKQNEVRAQWAAEKSLTRHEGWIALYHPYSGYSSIRMASQVYATEADCRKNTTSDALAYVKIEWAEE